MNAAGSTGVCAIVCAAGKGSRAGLGKNKLLQTLGGATVLERTLRAFDLPLIKEILVAAAEEDFCEIKEICGRFSRTRAVPGGATRFESVSLALKEATEEIVLVHDGARPFVRAESILACVTSVIQFGSGICAVPVVDTVALADGAGRIFDVPAREKVFLIQTPQGFYTKELRSAYERAARQGGTYTDDSSVFAAFFGQPRLCAGARDNRKLTFAEDFKEAFARVGFGVDTHAFGKAQGYILLAGVKIPAASGLLAHSDGDVLAHAVMDAMLSAAGLKDIGQYFPDTDEAFRGADSMQLLARVRELLAGRGFAVKNLSVAVQAERPRLAGYIDEIKAALAQALGIGVDDVGVSAGTNEGLGYIGEGKGITVNAYVLLKEI